MTAVCQNRPLVVHAGGADRIGPEAEGLLVLADEKVLVAGSQYQPELRDVVAAARTRLEAAGIDWRSAAIESRYARIGAISGR